MRAIQLFSCFVLAVTGLGVTGCGETTSATDYGDSATTITYWASNQGSSLANDQQILRPELDRFTERTGVKVKLEVIGWPDLLDRILAAAVSGRGPDVVNIGNTWSASLQATGSLLPFDDTTLAKVGGRSAFVPASLAATGAIGQPPIGVPLYAKAYALYYNKKAFAAAGISKPPSTWPELVADAKKLTGDGHWGLTLQAGQVTENAHFAAILGAQHGATLFGPDGVPHLEERPEVDAVLQYLNLMAADGIVDPDDAEYTDTSRSVADLATGRAAMFMTQGSVAAFVAAGMNPQDVGVAPVPFSSTDDTGVYTADAQRHVDSFVAGINIAVFKDSPHQVSALRLVQFLTSTDEQKVLNKAYGSLPTTVAAYTDPAFQTPEAKVLRQVLDSSAQPLPQVPQESQFEALTGTAIKVLFAEAAAGKTVTSGDVEAAFVQVDQQLAAAG